MDHQATDDIDTFNYNAISLLGNGDILFMQPPRIVSKRRALVIAAYLVAMVGDEDEWNRVRAAVEQA